MSLQLLLHLSIAAQHLKVNINLLCSQFIYVSRLPTVGVWRTSRTRDAVRIKLFPNCEGCMLLSVASELFRNVRLVPLTKASPISSHNRPDRDYALVVWSQNIFLHVCQIFWAAWRRIGRGNEQIIYQQCLHSVLPQIKLNPCGLRHWYHDVSLSENFATKKNLFCYTRQYKGCVRHLSPIFMLKCFMLLASLYGVKCICHVEVTSSLT